MALIDGKAIAKQIREEIAGEVEALIRAKGRRPGLAVILVGEDPASQVYVRNKTKTCQEAGFLLEQHNLPAAVSEMELLGLVDRLNRDDRFHGILVQLPLPKHIKSEQVLEAILPEKDVDGLHPANIGNMVLGRPGPRPCTPLGIMKLLDRSGVDVKGKRAVVVGRSNIVGKPIAFLLLERHATVTICHSRSENLKSEVERAEILVAAVGKSELIKGEWIRKGAVVIDVGQNWLSKDVVKGDVEFGPASQRASLITPVPGGVGPMTVAMLLHNTLQAARIQIAGEEAV